MVLTLITFKQSLEHLPVRTEAALPLTPPSTLLFNMCTLFAHLRPTLIPSALLRLSACLRVRTCPQQVSYLTFLDKVFLFDLAWLCLTVVEVCLVRHKEASRHSIKFLCPIRYVSAGQSAVSVRRRRALLRPPERCLSSRTCLLMHRRPRALRCAAPRESSAGVSQLGLPP